MKFEFLLLPEHGEQSKRNNKQIPLILPLRPGGHAAGTSPSPTSQVLLFIQESSADRDYITAAVPRVLPRRQATKRARSEIFKLSLPTG